MTPVTWLSPGAEELTVKHWAQGTPGSQNDTGREAIARWGTRVADPAGLAANNPAVSDRKMADTCAVGTRPEIKQGSTQADSYECKPNSLGPQEC